MLRQKSEESERWFKTVWFLVLVAVLLILAVFAVVALCLRRTSGDRTVFVRERDPLPMRPKSRSTAASSSSNYTPSEAHFNLGMVSSLRCLYYTSSPRDALPIFQNFTQIIIQGLCPK